jgi:hypothetical protein
MSTTNQMDRASRWEGVVLVAIVVLVGVAAGAASFTHVHDWTMANSPAGTHDWFGWANAVISELVPIAALLTIRRRKRTGGSIGYPMAMLVAAAGLSLAAQLGVAVGKVGPSGWLLSAVPALAFMALVKLVLAPVKTTDTRQDKAASATAELGDAASDTSRPTSTGSDDTPTTAPVVTTTDLVPASGPDVPAYLLPTARFAVVQHEQSTGRPITADELAARMSITPAVAGQLLTTINPPATAPARINGTPVLDGAR